MRTIIQNAVIVNSTGEVFRSTHVHDFVTIPVSEGQIAIDGGNEYLRRVGYSSDVTDISLDTEHSSLNDFLDNLLWGTYGKDGKDSPTWKRISTLELDHLTNIINTQKQLSPLTLFVITFWVREKSGNPGGSL
jgi:hypothetical protein